MFRTAILALALLFVSAPAPGDENDPRPWDQNYQAMPEVDAAMDRAAYEDKRLLLVLGANWCHDSRGLAGHFQDPELAAILEAHYVVEFVDIAWRDRNQDVHRRFGIAAVYGTPTVLIIDPQDQALINRDSVHDWRAAASVSLEDTRAYFESYARGEGPARDAVLAEGSNVYQALMIEIDLFEEEEAARLARAYLDIAAWRELPREERPDNFTALDREVERWRRDLPRQIAALRDQARDRVEMGLSRFAGPNGPDAAAIAAFDDSDPDIRLEMRAHQSALW